MSPIHVIFPIQCPYVISIFLFLAVSLSLLFQCSYYFLRYYFQSASGWLFYLSCHIFPIQCQLLHSYHLHRLSRSQSFSWLFLFFSCSKFYHSFPFYLNFLQNVVFPNSSLRIFSSLSFLYFQSSFLGCVFFWLSFPWPLAWQISAILHVRLLPFIRVICNFAINIPQIWWQVH